MPEEVVRGSPLDGLIDMEIRMLQGPEPSESGRVRGVNESQMPDLRDQAMQMFAPDMWDPAQEKSKVDDVVEFATRDCGADSPQAMVDLLNKMYQYGGGRGPFLDTCWAHIQKLRFLRASKKLGV